MEKRALAVVLATHFFAATFAAGLPTLGRPKVQQGSKAAASSAAVADLQKTFAEGEGALQRGELEAAEAAFRKVLAADPRAGAAYANLGVIAMRSRSWDQALLLLQRAEKLEPKMAGIRLNVGLVKYRRGDYAGAIAPLTSVVLDQPE